MILIISLDGLYDDGTSFLYIKSFISSNLFVYFNKYIKYKFSISGGDCNKNNALFNINGLKILYYTLIKFIKFGIILLSNNNSLYLLFSSSYFSLIPFVNKIDFKNIPNSSSSSLSGLLYKYNYYTFIIVDIIKDTR